MIVILSYLLALLFFILVIKVGYIGTKIFSRSYIAIIFYSFGAVFYSVLFILSFCAVKNMELPW